MKGAAIAAFAACALALLSGAAALSHQLLWTRRLIDLLGAGHDATSRVLGCFFLGLAIGAALAALLQSRIYKPWKTLGLLEVGIFLCTVPLILLPVWADRIWPILGPEGFESGLAGVIKLALSAATILPPALLMGFFLPLLIDGMKFFGGCSQRLSLILYGSNALGGVLGLIVALFFLLPHFGVQGAMILTGCLNLFLAAGCFAVHSRARISLPPPEERFPTRVRLDPPAPRFLIAAFLSGFAILGLEILLLQTFFLVAPISIFPPAILLGVAILFLAAGAFTAPLFLRIVGEEEVAIRSASAIAVISIVGGPLLFFFLANNFPWLVAPGSIPAFALRLFLMASASFGVALLAMGWIFPLTAFFASGNKANPAGTWAWLLAINGLGGLVGVEVCYRIVLPHFGLHPGFALIAAVYLPLVFIFSPLGLEARGWTRWIPTAALALFLAWVSVFHLSPLPSINPHAGLELLEKRSGREGTVAVVRHPSLGRGILLSNQYLLGSTSARFDQERQALLPLLLHHDPRSVAFLGMATGITPGAALQDERVEEIVVAEISPIVADLGGEFFAEENFDIANSPKARLLIEDARTLVAASPESFDVVVGDFYLPWGPGEARLFTTEHFAAVRRSLREDGLFCQWLPMHQITPRQLQSIAASFRSVFPNASLFFLGFSPLHPGLAFVGTNNDAPPDLEAAALRAESSSWREAIKDPLLRSGDGVRMLFLGGLDLIPEGVAQNTLNNCLVELDAGRGILEGTSEALFLKGPRWISLLSDFSQSPSSAISPSIPKILALEWEALHSDASSQQEFRARLREKLPPEIPRDPGADWARWPGVLLQP